MLPRRKYAEENVANNEEPSVVDPESVKLHDRTVVLMSESGGQLDYGQALRRAAGERATGAPRRLPVGQASVALDQLATVVMSESGGKLDYGQALRRARSDRAKLLNYFAELADRSG
jgi:hypothetical protein